MRSVSRKRARMEQEGLLARKGKRLERPGELAPVIYAGAYVMGFHKPREVAPVP